MTWLTKLKCQLTHENMDLTRENLGSRVSDSWYSDPTEIPVVFEIE